MWKHTKDDMDSETLIDYVWPLQTDGLETAEEGHEQLTPGGEWDGESLSKERYGLVLKDSHRMRV